MNCRLAAAAFALAFTVSTHAAPVLVLLQGSGTDPGLGPQVIINDNGELDLDPNPNAIRFEGTVGTHSGTFTAQVNTTGGSPLMQSAATFGSVLDSMGHANLLYTRLFAWDLGTLEVLTLQHQGLGSSIVFAGALPPMNFSGASLAVPETSTSAMGTPFLTNPYSLLLESSANAPVATGIRIPYTFGATLRASAVPDVGNTALLTIIGCAAVAFIRRRIA